MSEKPAPAPEVASPVATPTENVVPEITYEEFSKVRLVVGRVLESSKHPGADRLLVLKVDIGEDTPRTIVAGIADRYRPEELVGQQIIVVANLKPAKLRGILSQGMLLAAGGSEVQGLLTIGAPVTPGSQVR